MIWFLMLMLAGHPIMIDMPSKEMCQEVLKINLEYKGQCWAREPQEEPKQCSDDICEGSRGG